MKSQIKIICDKFLEKLKISHQEETAALRARSDCWIETEPRVHKCAHYEDIRTDYEKLNSKNIEQEKELEKFKSKNTEK